MMAILRNRTLLVILALALLVVVRVMPLPQIPIGGGSQPNQSPAGTATKGRGQATPTVRPVALGSQQVKEQLHPFLVLRTGTVRRGGPLVVGGQSFQPNQELAMTMKRQGDDGDAALELGTLTADKNGVVPDSSVQLPEGLSSGTYTITATPTMGGSPVETSVRVESDQTWGKLTSDTAKPSGAAGFEGGGFKPGETVYLYLDSLASQPLATVQASDQGDVSGVLRVPLAREGSHTILFYGDQSRMPAIVDLTILGFHPWVVLDNYSPGPEQQVGFAGSDFAPGERVHVFFNSLASGPVAAVQVADDGTFKAPGAVKLAPGVQGQQKMIFVGDASQVEAEVDFTIQPYPSVLQLTLWAGPPGSEVAFVGNGFAAGEEIRAYLGKPGQGTPVSTFHADEKGNFSGAGAFRVPRDTKVGELTVSATGQVSGTQASVTFKVLTLSPWADVKQDPSGGTVIGGHGFAVGEQVDLMVGQSDKAQATAEADKQGNVLFPAMQLPPGGNDGTSIRLKGKDSSGEAKTNYYGSGPSERSGESGNPGAGNLEFRPAGTPGSGTPTPQSGAGR